MYVLARAMMLMAVMLSVVVCATSQSGTPQSKEANANGSIAGRVTIAGKPAANVPVALIHDPQTGSRERLAISSTTDADGHFQLLHVPAGRFNVTAFAPAFYSEADADGYSEGKAVTLAEGESVDDINISLRRGGVITGRLADALGRPLIRERLNLYRISPTGEKHPHHLRNYNLMQTDDRGVYRLYGLPPGRYAVSAGTPIRLGSTRMGQGNSYYTQTFYPGTGDEAKAGEVEVTEGGEATAIDITLGRSEKAYNVILRLVAAESGKPVAGVRCGYGSMDPSGRYMGASAVGPESNARGECRIEGVLPGKYYALVASSSDGSQNYTYDPVAFEITDDDLNNVEVKLHAGASISGTVVIDGKSAQEAAAYFRNLYLAVSTSAPVGVPRFTRPEINADGSFRISGLSPGKARITFYSFPRRNFTLLRVERDGVDQTEGFDIAASDNITGLRLVFGIGTCTIRGELKIVNGTLPEGVRFVIIARRVGDSSPQNQYEAESDTRGRFVFDDLLPGDYEISAGSATITDGPVAAHVSFKEFRKTVSVTNDIAAQITILLERADGNNQ
jgi:Carboxypeptidase regulatory-like domain